jgi:hypothetical protein
VPAGIELFVEAEMLYCCRLHSFSGNMHNTLL